MSRSDNIHRPRSLDEWRADEDARRYRERAAREQKAAAQRARLDREIERKIDATVNAAVEIAERYKRRHVESTGDKADRAKPSAKKTSRKAPSVTKPRTAAKATSFRDFARAPKPLSPAKRAATVGRLAAASSSTFARATESLRRRRERDR